jgi:hypothetical protein
MIATRPPGATTALAAASSASSSSSSRFTAMRSAWNVRVAGSTPPMRDGPTARITARLRSSVVSSSPASRARLMHLAMRRDLRSSPSL